MEVGSSTLDDIQFDFLSLGLVEAKPLMDSTSRTSPEQLGVERGYEVPGLPLLKRVVAVEGDWVSVSSSGVIINEQLLPNSAPLLRDKEGRALPVMNMDHYRLGTDQAFLMGVTPSSWDSRYFGPVVFSLCSGSFVPVLTWP